jgi:GPH family glycoside/pentoside/hexuronide:cation symporter
MSDQTQEKRPPVTPLIQFAYGYQEFALGFMTNLGVMYFAFFMTDVALIAPAIVATIMLVGRIFDVFSVPVTGFIIQGSNFKSGKYSTWLLIAAPVIMLFNMLMFSNLPIPVAGKAVLMAVAYVLAYFFVNFCSTARMSVLPILTDDIQMRAVLSSRRGQGGAISQIVRGLIFVPMIVALTKFVGGSQVWGYFLSALVFGLISISGMYWLAFIARPFEAVSKVKEGPKPTFLDMIKQLGTNRPLLILLLAETVRVGATNLLVASNMYYFRYVLSNMMLMSVYLPITFIGGFIGNTVFGILAKKIDKKVAYILGMIIWIAGMGLAYFIAYGNATIFIACVTFAQFGVGISNGGVVAFFSDTSDYGEVKQGKNIRAINMGLVIFPLKTGILLGGTIQAYRLTAIGFKAGTTDPAVFNGIHTTATLFAALAGLVAILFILIYPLTKSKMAEIQDQLKAMHAQKA